MPIMLMGKFQCRMDTQELNRLRYVCKLRGESTSNFVRLTVRKEIALLGYGTAVECVVLGVSAPGDSYEGY